MHQVILACTYTFWAKSRNAVRLPETYSISRVLNFETFAIFCQIPDINTPQIINLLLSQNLIEMQNIFNEKQQF